MPKNFKQEVIFDVPDVVTSGSILFDYMFGSNKITVSAQDANGNTPVSGSVVINVNNLFQIVAFIQRATTT